MNRRSFVIGTGAGMATLLARPGAISDSRARNLFIAPLPPIGVQLYTVRQLASRDLAGTLGQVARAGFQEVEFAGYHGHKPAQVRAMLDDIGLRSPSAHVGPADIGQGWQTQLESAHVLGQSHLVMSWIDERDRTVDGYKRVAERFNEAGRAARAANVRFAYHNGSFEFAPFADGSTGYDILVRETDPENFALQMDVFWMRRAGQDPLAWFARLPGRFHSLHLKDMGPAPENAMVDVGKGVIDWPTILGARKAAGVRHVFVEHDEPAEPIASILASLAYVRSILSQPE